MIYRLSKNEQDWSRSLEVLINCITWLFPSILGIIPLFKVGGIHYSGADSWCWIDVRPTYARFAFAFIYNWTIILFILVLRLRAWYLHRSSEMSEYLNLTDGKSRVFRQLFWYPIFWIVLWVPSTVNRLFEAFYGDIFVLTCLQTVVFPLQGAVNAIVFLLTSGLLDEYKKTINSNIWNGLLFISGLFLKKAVIKIHYLLISFHYKVGFMVYTVCDFKHLEKIVFI